MFLQLFLASLQLCPRPNPSSWSHAIMDELKFMHNSTLVAPCARGNPIHAQTLKWTLLARIDGLKRKMGRFSLERGRREFFFQLFRERKFQYQMNNLGSNLLIYSLFENTILPLVLDVLDLIRLTEPACKLLKLHYRCSPL